MEMSEAGKIRCVSRLQQGTHLERVLCFITAASVITIGIMVVTLAYFGYHHNINLDSKEMNLSNVCLTPGCVKAASRILSSIDETIDPCNDFYRFVCGQWLKTHTIPEDEKAIDVLDEVDVKIKLRQKDLLEAKLDGTEPRFIRMAKDLYHACMDLDSIENVGAKPLKNILRNLGGWPVTEGRRWDESKFDWIESIISIRKLGYDALLKCEVAIDAKNTSRHILQLGSTPLGIPDYYLNNGLNDTVTDAYFKKMVNAATLLGADRKIAKTEMLEALKFEMALGEIIYSSESYTDTDNKYSIKQLQEMINEVPWLKYFNGLLMHEVYESETLIVDYPAAIKLLTDLIAKTDKRVIANYICWIVVHNSASLLSKEWRDIHLQFSTSLSGERRERPRWRQCLHYNELSAAVSSLYVRHHAQPQTKDEATKLVKYVYKAFLHILEDTDWMDEKTKARARDKAENMLFYIAYPDELLNDTVIMEHYQNLTITKGSYFENYQRIKKWSSDYDFSKLRKPNNRKDWTKYARVVVVNAFYEAEENSINLAVGYLNSPLFDKDQPNYMNFGTTGSLAGHEITHGFDSDGRLRDKDGNEVNWWEKKTEENFERKAQCVIDLYSNYTAENGMTVNGKNTLAENIADIGGLKEAYLAYQSWVKDNGPEKLLPGLKYNQNQLFWISSAFGSCSKSRPEDLKHLMLFDSHSPDEFRVLGTRSNLLEFARDFDCPLGSPMNRKDKCQVW